MAGRLTLVAHAETASARRGSFPVGDEALGPRGHAAIDAFVGSLPRSEEAVTSPALAARETAHAFGLDATIDEALRDLDVGRWRGQTMEAIAAKAAADASAFIAEPSFAAHGGESIADLVERVSSWLDRRKESRIPVLAITHAAVLRAAIMGILQAPPTAFWHLDVVPLQMLTLTTDGRRWVVRSFAAQP